MENLKIKHRLFENVESLSDDSFVASYKNKKYKILKFVPKSQEGNELIYALKKIQSSGISAPKLFLIDPKNGYAVIEYVTGPTVMELLNEKELDEKIFEQLFNTCYLAKISHMTLNYEIDKWIVVNDKLIYNYPMFIIYQKEKDLVERYIRLWFYTKEMADFMIKNGVLFDKSRLKNEYAVNKEIVLMTCKYYR